MFFAIIVMAIWGVYALFMKKRKGGKLRFYNALLPMVLLSIIIAIDLGANYLSAYNVQAHDGISVEGVFSPVIFGDDGWSIELFKSYFHNSLIFSVALLLIYSVLRAVEDK